MSERDHNIDGATDAELLGDAPEAGPSPGATGWDAWETPADEAGESGVAPSGSAGLRGAFAGLQPPWLLGALSAALVVLAGAIAFAAARRGLPATLDARGLVGLGLAAGGALALAALAGWSVSALASRYQRENLRQRDLLERVAALDPDEEAAWQDPVLRAETELNRFLDVLLARDRLQRTKLARAAIADGELARFGTALAAADRAAADASFETPGVTRAAAGAQALFAEIERLGQARAELEAKLAEAGGQAAAAAADARRWQAQSGSRLAALHASLQAVATEMQRLGGAFARKTASLEEIDRRGVPTLADLGATLPAGAPGEQAGHLVQAAHLIKDLVARGGSLAIQTALEVTRLGERGESLFPLTESLKSLVTEFQGVATRLEKAARDQEAAGLALAKAQEQLAEIAGAPGRDVPEVAAWRDGASRVEGLKSDLVRVHAELGQLGQAFGEQGARLEGLAGILAELTGVPCPPADETGVSGAPAGFEVESFGGQALGEPEAAAAPPAGGPTAGGVLPASPSGHRLFAEDDDSAAAPAPARPLSGSIFAPEESGAETSAAMAGAITSPPAEEERIYDLAELGAVAVDEPAPSPSAEGDRIYDLYELGAVAIG